MSVLAISVTTVALAEIGDKTQLLSLLLASRYRKPVPIIAAIFFATILNHALAAWLGVVVADYLSTDVLRWVLIGSFSIMALWVLIPDKLDDETKISGRGPFVASFIAFFIAEIGDKTQVATTVVGAIVTTYLSVEATIRVRYILPLKKTLADVQQENSSLKQRLAEMQQTSASY